MIRGRDLLNHMDGLQMTMCRGRSRSCLQSEQSNAAEQSTAQETQ